MQVFVATAGLKVHERRATERGTRMAGNESWMCQGRQEHGWFGDGTCGCGSTGDSGASNSDKAAADRLMQAAQAAYDR